MKYFVLLLVLIHFLACNQTTNSVSNSSVLNGETSSLFVDYSIDPLKKEITFFWKNKNGNVLGNAKKLKKYISTQGKELVFATNGGMYLKDQSPQGLYVENGNVLSKLDTVESAYGNFYMQPNGVFYITNENKASVCRSIEFVCDNVKFATQSGPMLIVDGQLHPKFNQSSSSKFIRNGVGILPNGDVLFVISKEKVNFYNFATYFKNKGCLNALYLDGFVSRTYLPSKNWIQEDGGFGVMIAVLD